MVFTFDTVQFGLEEFFERFKCKLPKIVTVTQGFHGDTIKDTFDRGQVIRLHTVSRQKRVGVTAHIHGITKYFGIPLDYKNIQLCVVDSKGNAGKEKSLARIVEKAKTFPVTVRFPRDQCITVGNQIISTNNLPCLIITQVFDEIYFLGNCINDGKMCMKVTYVPLYLSALRIALATGIAGKPDSSWTKYQEMLSQRAAEIVYKKNYGIPEMAEYVAVNQGKASYEKVCYMTPINYRNILPSIAVTTPTGPVLKLELANQNTTSMNSSDPVRDISKPAVDVSRQSNVRTAGRSKGDREETSDETDCYMTPIHDSNLLSRIAISMPTGPAVDVDRQINGREAPRSRGDITKKHRRLPPPPPHTMANDDVSPELENMHNYRPYYKDKPRDLVVPMASTRVMAKINATEAATEQESAILKPQDDESVSANETRRIANQRHMETDPIAAPGNENTTDELLSRHYHSSLHFYDNANLKGTAHAVRPAVNSPEDVTKLTIDNVSEYLKSLGLEDYVEDFRVQQVDGEVLSAINDDILKYEFGMKSIEATRLLLFIRKGHIPK